MLQKLIFFVLRLLLAGVFFFSALSKVLPIEPFEYFLVESSFIGLGVAPLVARLLVGIELVLGVFLISGLFLRRTLRFSMGLLALFSLFLLSTLIQQGNIENCGCFGDSIEMSPLVSLFKNLAMILISILLLRSIEGTPFPFAPKILGSIVLIGGLSFPFILEPPDDWVSYRYQSKSDKIGKKLEWEKIEPFTSNGKEIQIQKGKKILGFFSIHCRFCQLAGHKFTIMDQELFDKELPVYLIFYGDEGNLSTYWEESNSKKFPHKVIPTETFFELSESTLPTIYLLESGVVKKHLGFRTLNADSIRSFLNASPGSEK